MIFLIREIQIRKKDGFILENDPLTMQVYADNITGYDSDKIKKTKKVKKICNIDIGTVESNVVDTIDFDIPFEMIGNHAIFSIIGKSFKAGFNYGIRKTRLNKKDKE